MHRGLRGDLGTWHVQLQEITGWLGSYGDLLFGLTGPSVHGMCSEADRGAGAKAASRDGAAWLPPRPPPCDACSGAGAGEGTHTGGSRGVSHRLASRQAQDGGLSQQCRTSKALFLTVSQPASPPSERSTAL
jgi:hypothetical protein